MGMFDHNKFKSTNQDWKTPRIIFDKLDREFHFDKELATSECNSLMKNHYTEQDDALKQKWIGRNYLNPPFKDAGKWVKKAHDESQNGGMICMIIPSKTNTKWWHRYVMKAKEVRFIESRPVFEREGYEGNKHGLPFPLSIIIFEKTDQPTKYSSFTFQEEIIKEALVN